jgi:hypothetical protein
MSRLQVTCSRCGYDFGQLDRGERLGLVDRKCPDCGDTAHTTNKPLDLRVELRSGLESRLIVPWDGLSLTLAAAIYSVIVTVAGVVIAMVGSGGHGLGARATPSSSSGCSPSAFPGRRRSSG